MYKPRRIFTSLAVVFFSLCLALTPSLAQKGSRGGSGSKSSSKSSTSSKSSGAKTVHVKGYTRKDGTYVPPYDRAVPGSSSSSSSSSSDSSTRSRTSERSITSASTDVFASTRARTLGTERDKHGKIKRSAAAKYEFELSHPCPITGTAGKCPGYVIDHVMPLACGGADAPSNMQWQTKEAAKAKDRWERKGCQ
jgi:hypothetical protein